MVCTSRYCPTLQDDGQVQFSRQEWQQLYNRFNQTGIKKLSGEAQKCWSELKTEQGRSGKKAKQQKMIKAWIIDPNDGKFFQSRLNSITAAKSIEQEEEWVSRKRILEEYDESEAEEMVRIGAMEVRKNPSNPKRHQFKLSKVTSKNSWSSSSTFSALGPQILNIVSATCIAKVYSIELA